MKPFAHYIDMLSTFQNIPEVLFHIELSSLYGWTELINLCSSIIQGMLGLQNLYIEEICTILLSTLAYFKGVESCVIPKELYFYRRKRLRSFLSWAVASRGQTCRRGSDMGRSSNFLAEEYMVSPAVIVLMSSTSGSSSLLLDSGSSLVPVSSVSISSFVSCFSSFAVPFCNSFCFSPSSCKSQSCKTRELHFPLHFRTVGAGLCSS